MNIDYTLWPNPDGELGVNKVTIPTGTGDDTWPEGDALINNVVYKDGKISGFVDTKALTVNESATTTINYDYFDVEFSSIKEGDLTINRGPRSKYFNVRWGNASVEVIGLIRFEDMDEDTKTLLRSATKVVGNTLYDENNNVIGTFDTRRLVTGSNMDIKSGETTDGKEQDALWYGYGIEEPYPLTVFDSKLSNLTNGNAMFSYCPLTSWNIDIPKLSYGYGMFSYSSLNRWEGELPNLINGAMMFRDCKNLSEWKGTLPKLTNGFRMFSGTSLNTESIEIIADTINDVNELYNGAGAMDDVYKQLHIDIPNTDINERETAALNIIHSKGWSVYVNRMKYIPESQSTESALDENIQNVSSPIPYYAKAIETTEKCAEYIGEDGKYYIIVGGHYIFVDDPETYGIFTCEEDAATNMGLTKYVKPVEKV